MYFADRTHIFETRDRGCDAVRLFRQAGGCLEITQKTKGEQDDIIHVCSHEVDRFVEQLVDVLPQFIEQTPELH